MKCALYEEIPWAILRDAANMECFPLENRRAIVATVEKLNWLLGKRGRDKSEKICV